MSILNTTEVIADMNLRTGRPTPALDEILAILSDNLWRVMDAWGMPDRCQPKAFHWAGEADIGEKGWPDILVGGAFDTEEFGMGHMDNDEINVTVAYAPAVARRELQESLDIAGIVRGIMNHTSNRAQHYDPTDPTRRLWTSLHPLGFRLNPGGDGKRYSGWIARFLLRQTPGSNLWGTTV